MWVEETGQVSIRMNVAGSHQSFIYAYSLTPFVFGTQGDPGEKWSTLEQNKH